MPTWHWQLIDVSLLTKWNLFMQLYTRYYPGPRDFLSPRKELYFLSLRHFALRLSPFHGSSLRKPLASRVTRYHPRFLKHVNNTNNINSIKDWDIEIEIESINNPVGNHLWGICEKGVVLTNLFERFALGSLIFVTTTTKKCVNDLLMNMTSQACKQKL